MLCTIKRIIDSERIPLYYLNTLIPVIYPYFFVVMKPVIIGKVSKNGVRKNKKTKKWIDDSVQHLVRWDLTKNIRTWIPLPFLPCFPITTYVPIGITSFLLTKPLRPPTSFLHSTSLHSTNTLKISRVKQKFGN